jgi:polysaccharide chain length determinant protein (PEP-CTERM system associated)
MTTAGSQQLIEKTLEYWRLIARYKWQTLIAVPACMLVLTLIIATLPNEYEATTTILVDPQQVPEKYVSPALNSDPSERLNTITQEVLSGSRLQDIMKTFKLYADRTGRVSQEELIQEMRDHIRIQIRQGSGPQLSTFAITFQGKEPTVVAAIANELAASFIRRNITSREQLVEGTQAFLGSELQSAKHNLEEQENKLRVFKMSHLGETPDQITANLEAMAALRSTMQVNIDAGNRLEQEKLLLSRLPQTATAGTPDANLTRRDRLELEERQVEREIQQLRQEYSERYPDIARLKRRLQEITTELSSLPAPNTSTEDVSVTSVRMEVIERELKRLKGENTRMQAQLASYQAKIDAAPLREQQLIELTRNYDVSKQHYQTLLDKSFNIEMAASLEQKQKAERFTVLDPARVPEKPVKPRRKLLLLVAAMLSTALPCFFLVAQQVWKGNIATEADLKSLLPTGVRIVGLIPRIETVVQRRRGFRTAVAAVLVTVLLSASTLWIVWQMRHLL